MQAHTGVTSNPFGMWSVGPASPAEELSFGLAQDVSFSVSPSSPPPSDAPVWRCDLPSDPDEAAARLHVERERLDASDANLQAALARLDAFTPGADVSFAAQAQPEAELARLLDALHTPAPAESFGLRETLGGGWDEINQQFQDFVARLQHLVANYAWVETSIEGVQVGQTIVGWTGHVNTLWRLDLSPEQASLHQRNLALALDSRNALIKRFALVVQGAIKLSGMLATPGGAVLALPAAWNYINQVLAEFGPHPPNT